MTRIFTTDGKQHHVSDLAPEEAMRAIQEYRPIKIRGRVVIFNPEHVVAVDRKT